ncbi:MAG: SAM-dependent methyltransferase [Fusobacteriaceae bacterium]|nr:SAM-dependent methyltransferase [Fusobacteriaceae bacterium]MBN2838874.1 SAM-dependent methyltransferase [Fusobacteriaceae bacterium]
MEKLDLKVIGKIQNDGSGSKLVLNKNYIKGLTNINDFSYINIIWWFDKCDNSKSRTKLIENSPYKNAPNLLGTFATRSPERPNPIGLSCSYITYVDYDNGIIGLAYIDADNETPILDIKPYIPSLDRVENPIMPNWCSYWPKNIEESGKFNWEGVFNF